MVGESGSGKSVSAMAVMGLLPEHARVRGSVRLHDTELLGLGDDAMSRLRGRAVGMVFQDPMSALTPVYTVGDQIAEAITIHQPRVGRKAARDRAVELLELVGIAQPQRRARAFPHELSGGERQRVVIAIAIANDPDLLICDEPTTALDVTVQAQILEVLKTARDITGAGVLIITHDLGVVAELADRALVMYAGRVVESAAVASLYRDRRMPYTVGLLGSVPRLDAAQGTRLVPIPGAPPSLAGLDPGCPFAPRCPLAIDECRSQEPELLPVGPDHRAACIRTDQVDGRSAADIYGCAPTPPGRAGQLARRRSGARAVQDLSADQGRVTPQRRRSAGGGPDQFPAATGPHPGHRRRVRVGEIDHPARDPGTRCAAIGVHRGVGHRRRRVEPGEPTLAATRHPGGLPGPGRVAGPAAAGLRAARRTVAGQRLRQGPHQRARRRAARDWLRRADAPATPRSSPAGRNSASVSRERWRCNRRSSRSTNPSPHSTCPSRPGSSTCCWTCKRNFNCPICLSPMIFRWSSISPTTWQ